MPGGRTMVQNIQKDEIRIYHTTCMNLKRPEGVDTCSLCLGWKISGTVKKNIYQSAYEIQIKQNGIIIFDTGKTYGSDSQNIFVQVDTLRSSEKYTYRVKIWDQEDRESHWSKAAEFITGILDKTEWMKSSFILASNCPDTDVYRDSIWYRKTLNLKKNIRSAILHLAGIGIHEIYINGFKVGNKIFSPAKSRIYTLKRVMYNTYDITSFLTEGKNIIGIWNDAYWARQEGERISPVIKCILKITTDDKTTYYVTDDSWQWKKANISHHGGWEWGNFGGETVTGSSGGSWCERENAFSGWRNVKQIPVYPENISPDLTGGSVEGEPFFPVKIKTVKEKTVVDFGKNFTGWVRIKFKNGRQGQEVQIKTADKNTEESSYGQVSKFIYMGEEGEFCNKFNYAAGRYVTIEGSAQKFVKEDVEGICIRQSMEKTSSFHCSNPLLNQIYQADIDTYDATTYDGGTVDCPHRERLGYGESGISTYWGIGLLHYDATALYRHVFQNWMDIQQKDGYFPNVTPNFRGCGGTTWSSSLLISLYEYYKYTKDIRMVSWCFSSLEKWTGFLLKHLKNGLLEQYKEENCFIGDWAVPEQDWGTSMLEQAVFFNNCIAAYDLKIMGTFANALGKETQKNLYKESYRQMKKSVHDKYYNESKAVYYDGRQNNMAVAMCSGIVPESCKKKVYAKMESIIKGSNYLDGGSAGLVFIYQAIGEILRKPELLYDKLNRKTYPGFGYFLSCGHNTWPELWDMKDMWGGSCIHTCYSGVAGAIVRYIIGILPGKSGMKDFFVYPFFSDDLNELSFENDYGYGRIIISWKKKTAQIHYLAEIPANTSAVIMAPQGWYISDKDNVYTQLRIMAGVHKLEFIKYT